MSRPDDLIPLREATVLADRSLSSLRNWVRGGELSEYREDETNPGSRVMVSRAELMVLLATAKSAHPGGPRGEAPTEPAAAPTEKMSLLAAVAAAERDGLRALVDAQKVTISALEARCSDLDSRAHAERLRANEYRDRISVLDAELQQLRSWLNLPLYRRLISGPPVLRPGIVEHNEGGGSGYVVGAK